MTKTRLSSVQRTLRHLRQLGYICGIVERFNQYAGKFGIRQDLFNFIDIIALSEGNIVAIQACTTNFAEHDRKILENEIAPEWLRCGGEIQLWGWRKVKLIRGGKAMRWQPKVKTYQLEDFK